MAMAVEAAAMFAVQKIIAPTAMNYVMTAFEGFLTNSKDCSHKSIIKIRNEVTTLFPRTKIEFVKQLAEDVAPVRTQFRALQKLFEQLEENTKQMNHIVLEIDIKIRDFQTPFYYRSISTWWNYQLNVETNLENLKHCQQDFQQAYELLESWFPKLQPLVLQQSTSQAVKLPGVGTTLGDRPSRALADLLPSSQSQ